MKTVQALEADSLDSELHRKKLLEEVDGTIREILINNDGKLLDNVDAVCVLHDGEDDATKRLIKEASDEDGVTVHVRRLDFQTQ